MESQTEIGSKKIAERLNVSQARVRQLFLSGELQGRKLGRDWFAKVSEVERYAASKNK